MYKREKAIETQQVLHVYLPDGKKKTQQIEKMIETVGLMFYPQLISQVMESKAPWSRGEKVCV